MGGVDDVVRLFDEHGAEHHGEVVDQRSIALQCAALARAEAAPDHLVAAALLHDIGHLVVAAGSGARVDLSVEDDRHEAAGARWVVPRFGPSVARPIALHVLAKRYRCTVDPTYAASLSPTSVATLRTQGGLLDGAAVTRFEALPGVVESLLLRGWDEAAKEPGRPTVGIDSFLPELERLAVAAD
jgi:gamma-butyrobetaine dioxygenase